MSGFTFSLGIGRTVEKNAVFDGAVMRVEGAYIPGRTIYETQKRNLSLAMGAALPEVLHSTKAFPGEKLFMGVSVVGNHG